jgi:hypothetical protein
VSTAIILGYENLTNYVQGTTFENNFPNNRGHEPISSDTGNSQTVEPNQNSIPMAQTVFDSGTMRLPPSISGVIIFIPDEAHHPPEEDKTISAMNPNYLPSTLEIPEGTEVAFVHDDPSHTHIGIVKDKNGSTIWTTIPVEFPDGSDIKKLESSGSPYSVSDDQYSPPMEGRIIVTSEKTTGSLTVGGFFCPTKQMTECKTDFSNAGFQILSEHNFETKSVQKDISGPNTLIIYSTTLPIKDAITKLGPIIESLPYK